MEKKTRLAKNEKKIPGVSPRSRSGGSQNIILARKENGKGKRLAKAGAGWDKWTRK